MSSKKDKFKDQPPLPGFGGGGYKQAVNQVYEEYKKVDQALQDIVRVNPARPGIEDEFELCQEIAIALKQDLRESGISREVFCDEVNLYLGRSEERYKQDPRLCRKPLTETDLQKIISNPVDYPLKAYYLFAFQHTLGGFGIVNAIVGAKGGKVMSEEDRKLFALAKIGELKAQLQQFEKQLKK